MSHSVADDLLKQHSVPELRLLQDKLHKEASGKKLELQSMVGSRYLDFIQSADAISVMRDKAELMRAKLSSFQQCSTDLVVTTNDLLRGEKVTAPSSSSSSSTTTTTTTTAAASDEGFALAVTSSAPTSEQVWALLEKCDIFNASLSVQLSRLLLGDFSSGAGAYLSKVDALQVGLQRLLPKQVERRCSSCAFLQQTVVDDARLLLHTPNLTVTEQAQALAALGLLGGLRRAELLGRFFESATIMLSDADDEDGGGDDSHNTDDGDDSFDDGSNGELGDLQGLGSKARHLLKSVKILQKTILDAHALFFKPCASTSSTQQQQQQQQQPQVQEWLTLLKPAGLLAVQQLAFMSELLARFRQAMPRAGGEMADLAASVAFDKVGFDAKELKATGQAELKRVFDKWLGDAVRRVSDRSRRVLSGMQSAAQVARLQQLVYRCSTSVQNTHSMEDWRAASFDLLASPRLRARLEKEGEAGKPLGGGGSGNDDPTKLLWSTSLRAPFMMQVERLLRSSCQAVVTRAREQLVLALEGEGLTIDSFSLQVQAQTTSVPATSSSRLFRRAEGVRAQLEDDLLDLMGDIVRHPASGGAVAAADPQSSAALARAFYVQCSQLLAQLAVTLRTLCASMAKALEARTPANQRLLNGLLFLGRFAWLLKIRGKFLDEALVAPPTSSANGGPNNNAGGSQAALDLGSSSSSEDQIRSAFEIADTDGDGVVTYSEAVEAVQALAVGDADESSAGLSSPQSQTPFLSMLLTPSLTFTEMAMLCAHLLAPETCRPGLRLRSCIDDLISATHRAWSVAVVGDLGTTLRDDLNTELGLGGHGHFRALWRPHTLPDDVAEVVLVPTSCSASLSRFFLALNQRAAASLVSIDTVQSLPPPHADAASATRLSSQVLAQLHGLAVASAAAQYEATLATRAQDLKQHQSSSGSGGVTGVKASRKLVLERLSEDCALQAVFDLHVVEAVAARCGVGAAAAAAAGSKDKAALRAALQGWQGRLDPINAQLFTPLLQTASASFASRSYLLFPGVCPPAGVAPSSSAAASTEEDAIAGIFANGRDGAPCRFSLLPLAISSHGGSLRAGGDADSADAAPVPSAAAKGKKGGKSEGGAAAGLGKSIIQGLGSILGGT